MDRIITDTRTEPIDSIKHDLELLNNILQEIDYYIKLYECLKEPGSYYTLCVDFLDNKKERIDMGYTALQCMQDNYNILTEDILINRMLLSGIMYLAGFEEKEYWWQYTKTITSKGYNR